MLCQWCYRQRANITERKSTITGEWQLFQKSTYIDQFKYWLLYTVNVEKWNISADEVVTCFWFILLKCYLAIIDVFVNILCLRIYSFLGLYLIYIFNSFLGKKFRLLLYFSFIELSFSGAIHKIFFYIKKLFTDDVLLWWLHLTKALWKKITTIIWTSFLELLKICFVNAKLRLRGVITTSIEKL